MWGVWACCGHHGEGVKVGECPGWHPPAHFAKQCVLGRFHHHTTTLRAPRLACMASVAPNGGGWAVRAACRAQERGRTTSPCVLRHPAGVTMCRHTWNATASREVLSGGNGRHHIPTTALLNASSPTCSTQRPPHEICPVVSKWKFSSGSAKRRDEPPRIAKRL
jgi:hypothetical protein